jgi:hypothetical protein
VCLFTSPLPGSRLTLLFAVASALNGPRMDKDYQAVLETQPARAVAGKEDEAVEDGKQRDVNDLSAFPIEHARLRSLRALLLYEYFLRHC